MYLAGVSTRQVDDISQLLWGERMPSQTLSDKLKRVYADIDSWRTRPLEREYPYVFMDGVWHRRSWGGSVENVSVLVAVGVNSEGHRKVIGVAEGMKEDSASWEQFVRGMIERGLRGAGWWWATVARAWSPRCAPCSRGRGTSGAWGVPFCWTSLSLLFDYATSPSSRRRSMMLMPNSVLMRLSRYQTM